MTVREQGLRAARRKARELVKRWGIKTADDIRIEAIAKAEGLRIVEGPLRGARGRLSVGPKPVIRIADTTISDGARRFTIAHELAHHLLKHPVTCPEGACASARAAGPPEPSHRDYEAEANAFASELLLPANLVAPRCEGEPSLEIPRAIAFEFTMSVPASSITYVHLTRERAPPSIRSGAPWSGHRRAGDSSRASIRVGRFRADRWRTTARASRTSMIGLGLSLQTSGSTPRSTWRSSSTRPRFRRSVG